MRKTIYLIIGIVIFVLILGATYETTFIVSSDDKNNNTMQEEKIDEIVYKGKFPIPVENFIKVTSGFGYRDPVYNSKGEQISGGRSHLGLDMVGTLNSRVMCVKDGEVTHAGWQNSYGNCVEIKHTDENGKVFYTFYAHMQNNSLKVVKGQKVVLGQVIGIQGTTGNSTGDHLHFEIRLENKEQINPAPYLFDEV